MRRGLAFAVVLLMGCDGKGLDAFSDATLNVGYKTDDVVQLSFANSRDCTKVADRVRVTANGVPMRRMAAGCELGSTKSGLGRSAGPSFETDDPKIVRGGKTTFVVSDGVRTFTFETVLFGLKDGVELVSPKRIDGVAAEEPLRFRMKPVGRWKEERCSAQIEPPRDVRSADGGILFTRKMSCKVVSPTEIEVRLDPTDTSGVDASKVAGCSLEVKGDIDTDIRCEGAKTCSGWSFYMLTMPVRFASIKE